MNTSGDVRTGAGTGWEPPHPRRRPTVLPAAAALVIVVATTAVVATGTSRAFAAPYPEVAEPCMAADLAALTSVVGASPRPGRDLPGLCRFTYADDDGTPLATASVDITRAGSVLEARIAFAGYHDGDWAAVPGLGDEARIAVTEAGPCHTSLKVRDGNVAVTVGVAGRDDELPRLCDDLPAPLRAMATATLTRLGR